MIVILLIALGGLLLSYVYRKEMESKSKEDNEDSYNHCAETDYDYFNKRCL